MFYMKSRKWQLVNACHSSLSQITIAHPWQFDIHLPYPSSRSILFLVHCLSVRLGYISSSSLVSSFPAPLKRFLDIPVDRFPYSDPLRHFLKEKQPLKIPKIFCNFYIYLGDNNLDLTCLVDFVWGKTNRQNNSCLLVLHKEKLSRQLRILQAVSASWTPVTLLWLCSQLDRIQI